MGLYMILMWAVVPGQEQLRVFNSLYFRLVVKVLRQRVALSNIGAENAQDWET